MIRPVTLALAIAWLGAGIPAGAQTPVVNPRTVEFDPSADHAALTPDNQPVVQRYDLSFYLIGATQPVTTTALGKPAPGADGKIRVDFSTLVGGWPLADGAYEARVAAIGPSGAAASDPSNTFTFVQSAPVACTYALSTSSLAFTSVGGIGTVTVSAEATCAWTAAGAVSWLALTTGGGTGTGVASFNVDVNSASASRSATLTIGGQSLTITQAGTAPAPAPCSFALSQSSMAFAEAGGSGAVQVTTATGCAWTASAGAPWITVGNPAGEGSGGVAFTVGPSVEATARSATITVAGLPFTVTQEAQACAYKLSPASKAFNPNGSNASISIACGTGCPWVAISGASWVTLVSTSGQGADTLSYAVAKNSGSTPRTTTITVSGAVFTITQAAPERPSQPKKPKVTVIIGD